jgi:hypothetical protein
MRGSERKRIREGSFSAFNTLDDFEHLRTLCKKAKFMDRIYNSINDNPHFLFITFLLHGVTLFLTILCVRHFGYTNYQQTKEKCNNFYYNVL